jgi:RHS repeat-associated protein
MVTISRKLFYFLAFLFVLSMISSLGYANGQTVFGPKDCKITWWHIHISSHSFNVNDPGDGLIIITKNTPNKKIQTGFIVLNWRFIGLKDFLSGGDTVFEKDISLKSENNLAVFLIGTPEASITIEIRKKSTSPPPEVTFSADPSSIKLEESSTLSWTTTNANIATIDQEIGSVDLNGSHVVSPQETTTYTLTAIGLGGSTTKSTTVNVYPAPTVNITADPKAIEIGSASTLTWSSTNADSVTIDQGIGSVELHGTTTVTPTVTTTYTIIATGPGGTATDSAVVTVIALPDDVDHGLDTDEQQGGGGLVGETIRVLNGNTVESRLDLQFPSPNRLGLTLQAFYNSRSDITGSLGYGWIHTYGVSLDPAFMMGSSLYVKIVDQTGRAHYFKEDGDGLYAGVFNERTRVKAEAGGYAWYLLDGTKYAFSASGQLTWMDDSAGNRLELAYDTNNRLETVTDTSSGRILTFHYNADGQLTSITGPVTDAVPSPGTWVTYGYDDNQNLTSVTYADNSDFTYIYTDPNDVHNLTEKRDKAWHLLNTWAYDVRDRATDNFSRDGKGVSIVYESVIQVNVTDAYGKLREYFLGKVSGRKRISSIINGQGGAGGFPYSNSNAVSWIYDTSMRPTEVEYAGGAITQYQSYDTKGNPGTIRLAYNTPEERILTYTYHPDMNAPLSRTEPSVLGGGSKVTTWDYDNDYNTIPNEDPTGLVSRIIEKGFTKAIAGSIIPYEYITTFTYNSKGQVLSIDGPLPVSGDTTSFTYDPTTGDLLTITRPLIVGTSFSNYDNAGQVGLVTDINNQSKGFTYDGRGRVTLITNNADGSTTSVIYNTAGFPDSRTDEDGVIKSFLYDTLYGRLVKTTDHVGNYISYNYDLQGNMIEKSYYDPSDNRTNWKQYTYKDPAHNMPGKLYKEINPDNTFTKYEYDLEGNVASVTDPNNNTTSYEYDPLNRLITVTQPGNVVTSYTYDGHGNLQTVTDAELHTTTYEYDDMGRLLSTTSPDTGTVTYVYDEAGNPVSKTDAKGITLRYEYDLLNRLTNLNFPDSTQDIIYTYDTGANGTGRRTGMIDPSGNMTFGYDARGRLVEKTSIINSLTYSVFRAYTPGGRISSIAYPTGRTIDYDRTTCACGVDAVSTTYNGNTITLANNLSYRPFGIAKGMNTGAGGTVDNEFDLSGRLTVANPGTDKERIYTYDTNGNLSSVTAPNAPWYNRTYTYDALNRLDHAEGPYGIIDYTYDGVGNRLTKTENGVTGNYAYVTDTNILNTVTNTDTIIYTHDANGNITGIGNKTLTYNQNNRLIRVEENGTTLGEYTYNGLGQRVIKEVDGITTIFHYDFNGNIITESTIDGTFTKEYLYRGKGRSAMVDVSSGEIYYFGNDRLGTPQILTDSTNTVVWEGIYKPFGEADVNPNSSVVNNFRFSGQYYDQETGLHYNYHRYYDPKTGRYLKPDPIGMEAIAHLFAYVGNNPINEIDPSGLWGPVEHLRLTQLSMRAGTLFNQIDIERVKRANLNVDRLANQLNDPAHYMLGKQKESEKLIRDALERAIKYEMTGYHEKAMDALGEGLHTAQDRYAHYEQDAGWYEHLPLLGIDPDNPEKHPVEFYKAYLASIEYIDTFLNEVRRRRCEND